MTIRSWARATVLVLASALVCSWTGSPAIAGAKNAASIPVGASYPLALRGNLVVSSISTEGCNFCAGNEGTCSCLNVTNGTSSYWSWHNNPYTVIGFNAEVDYFTSASMLNGTAGLCSPAIGEITVQGTFSPNAVYAETVGMLCDATANTSSPDNPYSGATYSGSYLIEGDEGIFVDATGAGSLSFGLNDSAFTGAPTGGQLQMTGNITPNSGGCSARGAHC
ncbi:MAG TPA: hypothetical protein VMU41_05220 [Candidatus Binataceae bacterium]|nr:hypothetical protein [Candidatus Binataceae bacterium]